MAEPTPLTARQLYLIAGLLSLVVGGVGTGTIRAVDSATDTAIAAVAKETNELGKAVATLQEAVRGLKDVVSHLAEEQDGEIRALQERVRQLEIEVGRRGDVGYVDPGTPLVWLSRADRPLEAAPSRDS